jgi:hypothetical protein
MPQLTKSTFDGIEDEAELTTVLEGFERFAAYLRARRDLVRARAYDRPIAEHQRRVEENRLALPAEVRWS